MAKVLTDKGNPMRTNKIITLLVCSLAVIACAGKSTRELGVIEGKLRPCPASPNCVNSQHRNESHYIAPLKIPTTVADNKKLLIEIIEQMPRTKIVSENDQYLHVEFTTKIMRYTDDVEFLIEGNIVHVRSASRIGYSDLNANRNRIEEIRKLITEN